MHRLISGIKEIFTDLKPFEEAGSKLANFIDSRGGQVIITYAGKYASPARYSSLLSSSLGHSTIVWSHPQDLLYYTAPYDEGAEKGVVVYASKEGATTMSMLADQLTWTGHRMLVLSEGNLPDEVLYKLRDETVISLSEKHWILKTHLVSALGLTQCASKFGVREKRIAEELRTVKDVLDDLVTKYFGKVKEISEFLSGSPTVVTWTPTMMGAWETIREGWFSSNLIPSEPEVAPHLASRVGKLLVLGTDVEEFSIRPLKALSITSPVEVQELRLRTDPLTGAIYGIILAEMLVSYRVNGNGGQ